MQKALPVSRAVREAWCSARPKRRPSDPHCGRVDSADVAKLNEDARREEKARLKLLVRNFTSTAIRGVSCGRVDLWTVWCKEAMFRTWCRSLHGMSQQEPGVRWVGRRLPRQPLVPALPYWLRRSVLDAVLGDVAEDTWLSTVLQPNIVLMLTTAMILLPLSLLDSINDLRFASLAGVTCILYLICVVGYVFARSHISPTLRGLEALQAKGIFKMLSLSIFAFCCQPNVPSIYTELERRSYKRMQKVSVRAMLLCCFVYLLMGVTGFLAFGENTSGNVLGNLQPMLCANDWIVRSGVAGMAFAVTMAYPLNIFPIRFSVETALFYHKPHLDLPGMRTGIAVVAVACSLVVAIALPQINLVFELIGLLPVSVLWCTAEPQWACGIEATTGSFVCFLGPGLLFHRLVPGRMFARHKLKAVLLIVVGLLFLVLGTYSSVWA
eukprot:symbB.v1.2.024864.t2/scaffold2382.1/size80501/3